MSEPTIPSPDSPAAADLSAVSPIADACARSDQLLHQRLETTVARVLELERIEEARQQAEGLLRIQRDLAVVLAATHEQEDALGRLLDAVLQMKGIDCGAVYLVEQSSGHLALAAHRNVPDSLLARVARPGPDSPQTRAAAIGEPVYSQRSEVGQDYSFLGEDNLRVLASFPIRQENKTIAVLDLASRTLDKIPDGTRTAVETIAAEIGVVFGRVSATERMVDSGRNLQCLFDSLEDFVFILDLNGCVVHMNPVVSKRLGYAPDQLLGRSVLNVHPPEMREAAGRIMAELLAGTRSICDIPLLAADGSLIPVETKVKRGWWSGREALFGVSRDTTDRNRLQESLRKANEDLEARVVERTALLTEMNNRLEEELAERQRAEREARQYLGQIRRLTTGTDRLLEEERAWISKELHDELGQLLTALRINVSWLDARLSDGDETIAARFAEALDLITRSTEAARCLSKRLRPPILNHQGLLDAIQSHVADFERRSGIACTVTSAPPGFEVGDPVATTAYRIVQEALTNIARHAKASCCEVVVCLEGDELVIDVLDNGVGASDEQLIGAHSLGLLGMRERAGALGGSVCISNQPNGGISVHAHLPTTADAHSGIR